MLVYGSRIDISEVDHRRGERKVGEKQGVLVHEILESFLCGFGRLVGFSRQVGQGNIKNFSEELDLFFFRCEVLEAGILEDVIQAEELGFDVIDLVRAAMTQVFMANGPVNCLGSKMKDVGIPGQLIGSAVLIPTKLIEEIIHSFTRKERRHIG